MKKYMIAALLALFCLGNSFGAECNPTDVHLANPPKLENPDSFSMILFGDPQTYVKFPTSQPIFDMMTAWAAMYRHELKIKAALCTGDLVERNDTLTPVSKSRKNNGYAPSYEMWRSVSQAFGRLDGVMPYVLCTGNHDYGYESSENRMTHFNEYFPISKNPCWRDTLVSTCPNAYGLMTLENAAYEFDDVHWGKLLVIALEFAPRDEVLDWARTLTSSERFKNHRAIIITHSILRTSVKSVSIIEKEKYKLSPRNWAADVLKKLVGESKNIVLVLCGHSGVPKRFASNIDYERADGKKVPIVMFNPQSCGGWNGNGGDGWLRIMEFMPDGKTISMRTYSPLFAASETTQQFAWLDNSDNKFKIVLE